MLQAGRPTSVWPGAATGASHESRVARSDRWVTEPSSVFFSSPTRGLRRNLPSHEVAQNLTGGPFERKMIQDPRSGSMSIGGRVPSGNSHAGQWRWNQLSEESPHHLRGGTDESPKNPWSVFGDSCLLCQSLIHQDSFFPQFPVKGSTSGCGSGMYSLFKETSSGAIFEEDISGALKVPQWSRDPNQTGPNQGGPERTIMRSTRKEPICSNAFWITPETTEIFRDIPF